VAKEGTKMDPDLVAFERPLRWERECSILNNKGHA
jgi:hypothetical protein